MTRPGDSEPAAGEGARLCAARVLAEYVKSPVFLDVVLSSHLEACRLDRRDRALVTELVQGTVRMKGALDHVLTGFSNRALDALDPGVLSILRLGAYQVLYTDIPDYAACDLTADLARRLEGEHAVGFVNGVMRALTRGLGSIEWPKREDDPLSYLESRYSLPRWIVEMWVAELGLERAEEVCAASVVQPPLSLRCNLLRAGRDEVAEALAAEGAQVSFGRLAPEALLVKGSGLVADIDGYGRGLFSVQDQGSMVIGHLVDPKPGMEVLDVCAAPGGKANHLAELMSDDGLVLAVDMSSSRLEMVDESARRLGHGIIRTAAMDARRLNGRIERRFDRVLVDAPCTGLGTLARRPDARWIKSPEDVDRLAGLQLELLVEGAGMLKPGGVVVYSTCTISRRENQEVAEQFLEKSAGYTAVPVDGGPYLELYGLAGESDGMFAAVFRRE